MSEARFWLLKTEPDVYSIDDLARDGQTSWEGVRNYQEIPTGIPRARSGLPGRDAI